MNPAILLAHVSASLPRMTSAAAGSLVASVWQGIVLTLAVALCLRLLPRLTAAARSVIWTTVLLVVVALPVLSLRFGADHPTAAGHAQLLHVSERWSLLLVGVWAAFSLLRIGELALSAVRLRALARRAVPVPAAEAIHALLENSGRRAELCFSAEVDRPSVAGFFHPRILLPPELLGKLSAAELEQIVLHEMEHLRRRDDWTNLLQKLALALLPLNPVLLWLDRRLCLERELACDDGVLRATKARKAYAACLAGLAEESLVRRGVVLALGMAGRRQSELARRVYRILARPEAVMSPRQARFTTGALFAGLAAATVALAGSPRLVTFGPAPASVVQTASSIPVSSFPMVSRLPRATAARAVLVNAAMHPSQAPKAVLVNARNVSRPVAMKRVHPRAPKTTPWLMLTEWNAETLPSRLIPAVFHDGQLRAPQIQTVQFQDSQFTIAAVPVRGGWLIVQL